MDFINELPGNSSVKTVQHTTIDVAVFSMSSAPQPVLITDQWTRSLTRDMCFLCGLCREDIREYENGNWLHLSRSHLPNAQASRVCCPHSCLPQPGERFIMDTDASNVGIGGVLSQVQDGQEWVIAYCSKMLNKAERNYCVTWLELLAIVRTLEHFHKYLYGQVPPAHRPLCINLASEF
jgi:hypothetical protein